MEVACGCVVCLPDHAQASDTANLSISDSGYNYSIYVRL